MIHRRITDTAPAPTPMPYEIVALGSAIQLFGTAVTSISVTIPAPSQLIVRVTVRSAAEVQELGARLGCADMHLVTSGSGRTEWWSADRGDYGDPLMLRIMGGERDTCRRPAAVGGVR